MKRILCYGDSNTWGFIPGSGKRYPSDVRWTGVMSKALGEEYEVIEAGLNGRSRVRLFSSRKARTLLAFPPGSMATQDLAFSSWIR